LDAMTLGLSRFFGACDGTDVLKDILSGLKQLNANINIITYENKDDVAKIIELTDSSIGGLQSQFKNLNSEIATIRQNYVEATKNENVSISMISKNFGDIAGHMDSLKIILDTGQGSIMKLLRDKKLRENTEDASRYAKDFLKCINNQPWVLIYKESCN
ncbi:MAG: hypothetical protein KDK38_16870, partial [Leptospiraceae bacterium]|nr:hypothetical protein [Leptospiraceae bacterium]